MRVLAAALIFGLAAPAAHAQQPLINELGAATTLLFQDLDTEAFGKGVYFDRLTEGLAGKWFEASLHREKLADPARADQAVADACTLVPIEITVTPPWTITATRGGVHAGIWTYLSGSRFAAYADPKGIVDYYNLPEDDLYTRGRPLVVLGNQTVDLYRFSADVLIAVQDYGSPEIYGRCPGTDAAGHGAEALAALDVALGEEFDLQFPKVKTGNARETFIACVREVMVKVTPDDLETLLATRFKPPSDQEAHFQDAYPGISDQAGACMEAARATVGG